MEDDYSDYEYDSDNEWIYTEESYELAVRHLRAEC